MYSILTPVKFKLLKVNLSFWYFYIPLLTKLTISLEAISQLKPMEPGRSRIICKDVSRHESNSSSLTHVKHKKDKVY